MWPDVDASAVLKGTSPDFSLSRFFCEVQGQGEGDKAVRSSSDHIYENQPDKSCLHGGIKKCLLILL